MYQFIYDIDELKFFYDNILPPLETTEVYFISLSARNKYLTEEERIKYELGRTEMFCKEIVRKREWERFLRIIRKFECNEGGYTTKNNSNIPQKCITCYININPSETLQSLKHFNNIVSEYMDELAHIAFQKKGNNNIAERLNKLDNNLMTCYQQSRGVRHWIDIDIDIPKDIKIGNDNKINKFLIDNNIKNYWWIDTKFGYHLLIKKKELKFDPNNIIIFMYDRIRDILLWNEENRIDAITITQEIYNKCELKAHDYEIIVNKNEMIPVPGLLQGEYLVRILNK